MITTARRLLRVYFFSDGSWNQPICKGSMFSERPLFPGKWRLQNLWAERVQGITHCSFIYRWRNGGSERVCDLVRVTREVHGITGTGVQIFWASYCPFLLSLPHRIFSVWKTCYLYKGEQGLTVPCKFCWDCMSRISWIHKTKKRHFSVEKFYREFLCRERDISQLNEYHEYHDRFPLCSGKIQCL